MKSCELRELLLRDRHELARRRDAPAWRCCQAAIGSPPFRRDGDAAELLLRRLQLAHRNRQQPIGAAA